jgi:hypothetical protein
MAAAIAADAPALLVLVMVISLSCPFVQSENT